ncbi:WD40-repeat-containing domain protein [Naematelia encephala]|uniref:WD40-repeat-containing domain protein n=1 Tax=Naematelia encephala TaxID=71784 RepID=A0A1Y2BJ24_9TREE|nr:WD40-repeat-containing domain protein [Naematelia encephala]
MASTDPIEIDDEERDEAEINQSINEEYKIWKKNTPFLYDTVINHSLAWPSLTCQWLPDRETPKDADYTIHRMILGTHTSGQDADALLIAEVFLPKSALEMGKDVAEMYDEERQEFGSHGKSPARIQVKQTIRHQGEVNRARYMPQNPDLIATKTTMGEVFVFDRTKHETKPAANAECKPDIRLKGLNKEGYGLAWSKVKSGHILSAGDEGIIAHWDIEGYTKSSPSIQPLRKYTGHDGTVGDVDWHPSYDYMFASGGDDKQLMLWDTRSAITSKPDVQVEAHERGEINAVAFAPSSEYLILTGSNDHTIGLFDIRKLSRKLHSFEGHVDGILQLAWSPHSPVHFASASADRRVHIWNLDAIGAEQTPEDAEDGPPELLFVHGGHTAKVSDISWSPMAKWHIATTAEDNILQVWEPSRNIRAGGEADVSAMDLGE